MKPRVLALVLTGGLVAAAGVGAPVEPPPRAGPARLHETGAPPGHTGAPGEPTCHVCHYDLELNEPEGRLGVVGFPEAYEAGTSYGVTIVLTSRGMERAGFQATVSRGTLAPVGPETKVFADSLGRRQYVGHAAGYTRPESSEQTSWLFEWTAPDPRVGPVQLHVAANSGNGDASPLGDFVYATSRESRETRSTPRARRPQKARGSNSDRSPLLPLWVAGVGSGEHPVARIQLTMGVPFSPIKCCRKAITVPTPFRDGLALELR